MSQDETFPYYSRCSVGKSKWQWCVWQSFDDLCEGKMAAHGTAPTALEAEAAALQVAPDAKQMQSGFASNFRRRQTAKAKAERPGKTDHAQPLEFLYQDWTSDYDGETHSTPHLVVKKTAKKVFVERDCYSPNRQRHGDWQDYYNRRTYALDRAKLERDGDASSGRGWWEFFYTEPFEKRQRATRQVPPCFAALGLGHGASEYQIKQAFRKLCLVHHPDRGGDPEQFKRVAQAYEEAMAITNNKGVTA